MRKFFGSLKGRLQLCMGISAVGMVLVLLFFSRSFSAQIQEQIDTKVVSLSGLIEKSIATNFETLDKISRLASYSTPTQLYLLSPTPTVVIENSSKAMELGNYAFTDNSFCKNVYLYSSKGRYLAYNQSYWKVIRDKLSEYGIYQNLNFPEPFFSDIFYLSRDGKKALSMPEESTTPYAVYFYPVYSNVASVDSTKNNIISAALLDMSALSADFRNLYGGENLILYSPEKIVSTGGTLPPGDLLETIKRVGYFQKEFVFGGTKYLVKRIHMKKVDADFLYFTRAEDVVGALYQRRNSMLLVLILVSLCTLLLIAGLLNGVQGSIRDIVYDTTHLRGRGGTVNIRGSSFTELREISESINGLVERLDISAKAAQENATQLLEAKVAQNNAELIGYRSQINPHFLFNTLECMRSMAHIYRAEPIEHIVSSMAKMFRYSLYSPMQVTLEDELRHVESYVGVMNQRFLDKFHLKIQVSPETRRCTLVSMILQPIVENAILHGFPAKQKYCCISISATGSGDNWVIRMTDNGRGISKEKCREINEDLRLKKDDPHEEKSSISLRNIYRRMTLVTGGNFFLELRSRESFYTQVEYRCSMKR